MSNKRDWRRWQAAAWILSSLCLLMSCSTLRSIRAQSTSCVVPPQVLLQEREVRPWIRGGTFKDALALLLEYHRELVASNEDKAAIRGFYEDACQ